MKTKATATAASTPGTVIVVKETTKNAEYPLYTYELSSDKMKLHAYLNRDGIWIRYEEPLYFNPRGRTFEKKSTRASCSKLS